MRPVSANQEKMKEFTIIVGKAIQKRWPPEDKSGKTIKIQMDNATPHITEDNPN